MQTDELVTVTQADRDAAADYEERLPPHSGGQVIRDGVADDLPLVQAFARHRIAAIAAARPAILEEAAGGLRKAWRLMMWQPIETAPRDGSAFLGFCAHDGVSYWLLQSDGESLYSDDTGKKVYVPCATHWMPLPPPPERLRGDG